MARTPARTGPSALDRAKARRIWSTVVWWLFVAVFVYNAVAIGQAFFWLPAVAFGAAAVMTTRLALSSTAPERHALVPGELAAAKKGDRAETPATVVPPSPKSAALRPGRPKPGTLAFADGRLSFTADDGETVFALPVKKIRLATVPGFLRPQLDLDLPEGLATVRFFPMWDLGATVVGPVVAGEWYQQLRALGAS